MPLTSATIQLAIVLMDRYVSEMGNVLDETNLIVAQGLLYMAVKFNENFD